MYAGAALRSTVTFIPLLEIVIGTIVIARLFGAGAIATYIGAWLCTLGILRFVTRLAAAIHRAWPYRRNTATGVALSAASILAALRAEA